MLLYSVAKLEKNRGDALPCEFMNYEFDIIHGENLLLIIDLCFDVGAYAPIDNI